MPYPFQLIPLSHLRGKKMDDEERVVEHDPLPMLQSLYMRRSYSPFSHFLLNFMGNSRHMPTDMAVGKEETVGC